MRIFLFVSVLIFNLLSFSFAQIKVTVRESIIKGTSVGEVMFDDKVIIRLSKSAGGYSPYERAKIVSQRLTKLIEGKVTIEDFKIERVDKSTVITAKGKGIVSTDLDAPLNNTTPEKLAQLWLTNIKSAFKNVSVVKSSPQGDELGPVKNCLDLAKEYLKTGKDTLVIATYRRGIKTNPQAVIIYRELGSFYQSKNLPGFAVDVYLACLENNPDAWDIRRELALTYEIMDRVTLTLGKYERMALEEWTKLLATEYDTEAKKHIGLLSK